jgi:hypothetical protein
MKTLASALILGLTLLAGFSTPAPQEDLKKLLPDAEGVKRSARKLSKEARERIEKALDRKLDDKEAAPAIWECRANVAEANANDKVRVLYTVVTGKGPKGEFKIGVAIAPEERYVAGVQVVENKDDPAIAAENFLLRLEQIPFTGNLANPPSVLAELRKTAATRKDEKLKQTDGILKLHDLMHPVQRHWDSLEAHLDKDGKEAAADADAIAKLFGEAEKTLADFTFLKTSQSDAFRRRLRDGVKELGTLAQHVKNGKMAEARATAAEIGRTSCSQCHAGTRRIFLNKRNDLGLGNGYFAPGLDVYVPAGPKESFEAAVTAIRTAVLILSEAK